MRHPSDRVALWFAQLTNRELHVLKAAPYVMVGVYAPALVMVLLQGKRIQ